MKIIFGEFVKMFLNNPMFSLVFIAIAFKLTVAENENITPSIININLQANETDAAEIFPSSNFTSGVILDSAKVQFPGRTKIQNITDASNALYEFPKPVRANKTENGTVSPIEPTMSETEKEELKDLLTHKDAHPITNTDVVPETIHSTSINNEVEEIENGENTEENRLQHHVENISEPSGGVSLFQGQVAAILAGVFAVTSVIAYMGLLYWRRYLENRYGSRTMLVDDDFYDPDGMRNFSI